MQLLSNPASPYTRKCRIIILEKGLKDRVEIVNVNPYENPPNLLAVHPLSTIPALDTGHGLKLGGSQVVAEYLDLLAAEPVLYPKEGEERFKALGVASLADGIMDAAVTCVLDSKRPEINRNPDWVVRKGAAIQRGISKLETEIPMLATPLNIGTIAAACALGYIDFRLKDFNWKEAYPQLAAWYAHIIQRPAFAETAPKD